MPITSTTLGMRVANILISAMDSIDASTSTYTYNSGTYDVYLMKFRNTGFGYTTTQTRGSD